MPQIITNTAELSCNQGTATSKLNVTSQDFVTIEGKAMATEEDKQANSNIQPFKQCKLKPSSGGYLPCVPAPIQWEDAAEKDTLMGFYHNNDSKTPFQPESSTAVIESFKNEYRNVTIDRNGTPYRYFVPKLMRKILLYIVVLTINHMMAQENKNSLKDTIMFEKFDFNLWNTRYKDFEKDPKYGDYYKLKDGSSFRPMCGGENYTFYDVIPPLPAYYHCFYDYYGNGNLKAYGKYASMEIKVKIGIWHYFDENGKETQVDEEAKLGKWTFNAILEVLHKDGVIDLYTGKNRDWDKLYIEFKNNNREVAVIVFKERIDILIDTYYEYIFNCKTGKYTREEFERYNENAKDMPTLPPLKNSKKNKRKRKNSISISEEEYQDLQILQCKTINNNNKAECLNDRVMFEYFDFELHNRNYEGYDKEIGNPHFYKAKDGNLFKGVNFGGENIYYIVIPLLARACSSCLL